MNPREFAKSRTLLSKLIEGKTKVESEDIAGKPLTLINFEMIQLGNSEPFPVCIFKEYPESFYFGGMVLADLVTALHQEYGADVQAELDACGGIPIELVETPSKQNKTRNYYKVVIRDEKENGGRK